MAFNPETFIPKAQRVYRDAFHRPVRGGRPGGRFQAKLWRRLLGLARPMRCPVCRQYTRQLPIAPDALPPLRSVTAALLGRAKPRRRCLSCKTEWTPAAARQATPPKRTATGRVRR